MIRNKTLLVTLLSSTFLFPSTSVAAAWSDYLARILEELIEQERWHSGGLRRERMLQIHRRAIATKDLEVVAEIQGEVVRQARRGQVDLEPYRALQAAIERLPREGTRYENSTSTFLEQANFYRLSRRARREIYRETLQSQREQPDTSRRIVIRGDVFWLSWYSAAIGALDEKMDDLLPLIEQGHYVERGHRDGAVESLERQLNAEPDGRGGRGLPREPRGRRGFRSPRIHGAAGRARRRLGAGALRGLRRPDHPRSLLARS
jgi:hypothetical protein